MKKILGFFVFFFSCISSAICANVISSDIKEVLLFTNQALITREATVRVKAGLNEIHIETNSYSIDKDSVQALVYGKGEVYGVQYREIPLKEAPQSNIRGLVLKFEDLQYTRQSLSNKKNVLAKKSNFLDSLTNFAKIQISKDVKTQYPKVESLNKSLNFLDESYSQISKDEEALNKKIRDLDKEIRLIKKKISDIQGIARKTKKVIEVIFNSKKDQRIGIEVSYLVYNAYWSPFYKVDVSKELKSIHLSMFSKIHQKTGEDWKNVKLSISNVVPLKGVTLPSLSSWYLKVQKPRRQRYGGAKRKYEMKASMLMNKADTFEYEEGLAFSSLRQQVPKAQVSQAQAKKLPLSFEYELPHKFSLESKNKEAILPIFSKTLSGKFSYYSIPKMSSLTFLVCKIKSDEEFLSGNLNVHFAGRFVGKMFLPEKRAGEEFNLSLGADRQVKVKREKIKDKVKETFFKKISRQTIIRDVAFKITVENLKKKHIVLKLIDNIPVSQTDRIEVKNLKISPEPTKKKYLDKEGVNLWALRLKPGEKKEINIEFTLTYPKGTYIPEL